MSRRAVFLDRDGTMIHEAHYLSRREDLKWFSWTSEAIRLLNRAGFVVCVTTNQGGIALGLYTEAFMLGLHEEMNATLAAAGARVDGWFYCPHHPQGTVAALRMDCDCRKPHPGMVRQAAAQFDIAPERSFVIGDKHGDLGLAENVGAVGILVRTGYGQELFESHGGAVPGAAHVAADLMAATAWILSQAGHPLGSMPGAGDPVRA